jgi:hypothetical protein
MSWVVDLRRKRDAFCCCVLSIDIVVEKCLCVPILLSPHLSSLGGVTSSYLRTKNICIASAHTFVENRKCLIYAGGTPLYGVGVVVMMMMMITLCGNIKYVHMEVSGTQTHSDWVDSCTCIIILGE